MEKGLGELHSTTVEHVVFNDTSVGTIGAEAANSPEVLSVQCKSNGVECM
jgi:hypothetical protein